MKKIADTLLGVIDRAIVRLAGWEHIPYTSSNFMYLSPYKYKGTPITLKDGTLISKGDLIAELHIDNTNIKLLNTSYPNLIKLLKSELFALKLSCKEEPYSEIKAVYGVTVFYNIAARQNFTVIDIRSNLKKFFGSIWENILRLTFKNGNKKTRKKFIVSKECWLSITQILGMD